jgi:hypothetical protein
MPLAKSSAAPSSQTVEVKSTPTPSVGTSGSFMWEDVPIDIYRQFDIELGTIESKEITKIRDIYQWAQSKCDEPTLGNVMKRISTLENTLGSPAIGSKRYDKMWSFIKLQRQVDDLLKRQEAMKVRPWI